MLYKFMELFDMFLAALDFDSTLVSARLQISDEQEHTIMQAQSKRMIKGRSQEEFKVNLTKYYLDAESGVCKGRMMVYMDRRDTDQKAKWPEEGSEDIWEKEQ